MKAGSRNGERTTSWWHAAASTPSSTGSSCWKKRSSTCRKEDAGRGDTRKGVRLRAHAPVADLSETLPASGGDRDRTEHSRLLPRGGPPALREDRGGREHRTARSARSPPDHPLLLRRHALPGGRAVSQCLPDA